MTHDNATKFSLRPVLDSLVAKRLTIVLDGLNEDLNSSSNENLELFDV